MKKEMTEGIARVKKLGMFKIALAIISLVVVLGVPGFILGEYVAVQRFDGFVESGLSECLDALESCRDNCPFGRQERTFNVSGWGE